LSDSDDDVRWLCAICIGESYLRQKVEDEGEEQTCSYCDTVGQCFTIEAVADLVETAFEQHYTRTNTDPDHWQEMMIRDKESDYNWYREGEETAAAIADAIEIDEWPASDIQEILEKRHSMGIDDVGDETEFSSEAHYEPKGADDSRIMTAWLRFEEYLKKKNRFFSQDAAETLKSVFQGLDTLTSHKGKRPIITAGPRTRLKSLYRARSFQSADSLRKAIEYPEREIGPPPFNLAKAGRMNAAGISVFYGATDPDVALSEVRPPVGSRVIVARFDIVRPLRLLDLAILRQIGTTGSIFDAEFIHQRERAKFLEKLSSRIVVPVMPGDEVYDYLPTQVIADYLASEADPPLDGIIYPSVQTQKKSAKNVILFHKSSMVVPSDLPPKSVVAGTLSMSTEDGEEPYYSVWETLPPEEPAKDDGDRVPIPFSAFEFFDPVVDDNTRTPALKLDTSSLIVHEIKTVRFTTSRQAVGRHRRTAKESENSDF
jgi:hypothetical protein